MDGFDSYGPSNDDFHIDPAIEPLLLSSGYVSAGGIGVSSDTRTGYGKSVWTSWDSFGVAADLRLAFVPKPAIVTGFALKYQYEDLNHLIGFMFDNRLGTVTPQLIAFINAEGGISLSIDGGTSLLAASPPNIIFPNVWQYIEMKYTPNKTVGQIIIKVDGQTCIQYDGPTSPQTTPNEVNMLRWYSTAADWSLAYADFSNGVKWFDDLYVCDTDGDGFNDFLGDVIVHSVQVVSDQTPNSLSQFGGSAGHFTSVQEFPPDEDTSYLYGNTLGDREMFGIDTLPDNIIDVLAVSTHVRAKKDAPGTSNVKCVTKSGTHEVVGAEQPLAVEYVTKNQFLEQCPDGTGWTKAKAEALVVGFEVA